MAIPSFLEDRDLRLVLFGGKGGVGKTTCAAATALQWARSLPHASLLLVSTDPAHSLFDSLAELAPPPNLRVLELDAAQCLADFRNDHLRTLHEIASRSTFLDDQDISRVLDLSLPGMDELMAFLQIARWVEARTYDHIIVDTAPTGHTMRLLTMPRFFRKWLEALDALLAKHRYMMRLFHGAYQRDQLDGFLEGFAGTVKQTETLLHDAAHCRFVPVTVAEELSLRETAELAAELSRTRVPVTEIVVNRLYPGGGCAVCTDGHGWQMRALARARRPGGLAAYSFWGVPLYAAEVRGESALGSFWSGVAALEATEDAGQDPAGVADAGDAGGHTGLGLLPEDSAALGVPLEGRALEPGLGAPQERAVLAAALGSPAERGAPRHAGPLVAPPDRGSASSRWARPRTPIALGLAPSCLPRERRPVRRLPDPPGRGDLGELPHRLPAEPRVENPADLPSPGTALLLFAGKGGVGKTTLSCATAVRLAEEMEGREVLLFSADPAHSLSACLDLPVGPAPTRVRPGLSAMEVDAAAEFAALKHQYHKELQRLLPTLSPNLDLAFDGEMMDRMFDLSPPGLDEAMALTRLIEIVASRQYDMVVVDSAPTGHLIRLLELPEVIDQWLKMLFGLFLKYRRILNLPKTTARLVQMSKDLKALRALLHDPCRSALCIVAIPTEMALDETVDLVDACERMGVSHPVMLLNLATPASECSLCAAVCRRESRVREKYAEVFADKHRVVVYRQGEPRGLHLLAALGQALYRQDRDH